MYFIWFLKINDTNTRKVLFSTISFHNYSSFRISFLKIPIGNRINFNNLMAESNYIWIKPGLLPFLILNERV